MAEAQKTQGATGEQSAQAKGAKKAPQAREKRKKSPWTLERCQKAARRFDSQGDWQAGAPSSFKAATSMGWVSECTVHMTTKATPISAAKRKVDPPKTHKRSA